MSAKPTIVAVNGSPHSGIGNTSIMLEMFRKPLKEEGYALEIIQLAEQKIEYCQGCGFCMEKGQCWIEDDHRKIVSRLLEADGVIMASPVYFNHVTGQMKTFLDRSLAYGHKPRTTWKPGLAVCVSAGYGETQTGQYLAGVLRPFGAFAVGTLTAMAVAPGGFLGRENVEARAVDLARDLARAIKEKRRYPATDQELHFYQFMSNLVRDFKDSVMKHDDKHWREHGLYDGFESYVQQAWEQTPDTGAFRDAWIKEMISNYKETKKMTLSPDQDKNQAPNPTPETCLEMIKRMPRGFNASAADGLTAVYQFEVSGDENFTAHLSIADGQCAYHDGPAEKPSVVVKTPASVWLAIANGDVSGQQAFMSGQYKVEGDLMLLMKLGALFSRK